MRRNRRNLSNCCFLVEFFGVAVLIFLCVYLALKSSRLEFYMNKCNDLEKEIADVQESHTRDTEEWKKFQADLQTAVRVANDFMMGRLK